MFKFNLIQKAIICSTGVSVVTGEIVNACLNDEVTVSLVFPGKKIAIVKGGKVITSDLNYTLVEDLEVFLDVNVQLRATRKAEKTLRIQLQEYYAAPDAAEVALDSLPKSNNAAGLQNLYANKKKFTEVVDLQDLAEGDTIVLRNGTQLKVDIISCMEPNRITISDGNMYIDCCEDGTSHRGQCPHHDVVQIIKA